MTLRLHSKVYQHKLSYLWLQDHPWRFRSSTPLMTSDGSNFYNTGSWVSSRNNTSRRYERVFWIQNPRYKKRHTFLTLKSLTKTCLGFPLYTRRSIFETLILNRLELCLGWLKILRTRVSTGRAYFLINRTRQFLNSSLCNLYILESWLVSP